MSKSNKDGAERKVRRDAKLKHLADATQRKLIADWLAQDGADSCLQRMRSELSIEVSQATLYDALAYWRTQERFGALKSIAVSQAEIEAEARGGMTADAMEQAVDRNFLGLAAQLQDTGLYLELRSLRIRDQSAKNEMRIAEAKLKQGDAKIAQKNQDLQLAERRVKLLEDNAAKAKEKLTQIATTASKGGLSKETLKQIEEAAALL